ncbi:MAG: DUF6265 family protein [Bacteroidota bacterium]
MRRFFVRSVIMVVHLLLFAFACQPASQKDESRSGLASFSWLVGEWQRENDDVGKQTFEYWEQLSDTVYTGLGCTIAAGDTTFREDLRIHRSAGSWFLEVTGVHEEPVQFKIIAVQPTGFLATNPDNEFPKEIRYTKTENALSAVISDGQNEIAFDFIVKK